MADPEKSAESICNLLFFRGLLEMLNRMIENYDEFFKPEVYQKEMVDELIKAVNNSIKDPEKLFGLKFNEQYKGGTKNNIIEKVEKFLDDYVNGKINVYIHPLDN